MSSLRLGESRCPLAQESPKSAPMSRGVGTLVQLSDACLVFEVGEGLSIVGTDLGCAVQFSVLEEEYVTRSARFVLSFVLTFILFFLVLPSLVVLAYMGCDLLVDLRVIPTPWSHLAAAVSFVFGWWWMVWSNLHIFERGQGTSLEVVGRVNNPTRHLVLSGPYVYSRNPMAFGFVVAYVLGLGLLLHTAWCLVLTPLSFLFLRLYLAHWEEKGLVRRFGDEYLRYRGSVPAFIPRPWRRLAVEESVSNRVVGGGTHQ